MCTFVSSCCFVLVDYTRDWSRVKMLTTVLCYSALIYPDVVKRLLQIPFKVLVLLLLLFFFFFLFTYILLFAWHLSSIRGHDCEVVTHVDYIHLEFFFSPPLLVGSTSTTKLGEVILFLFVLLFQRFRWTPVIIWCF